MRATRDLLRRRNHFTRKRAEFIAHIHNTVSHYNLPPLEGNPRIQPSIPALFTRSNRANLIPNLTAIGTSYFYAVPNWTSASSAPSPAFEEDGTPVVFVRRKQHSRVQESFLGRPANTGTAAAPVAASGDPLYVFVAATRFVWPAPVEIQARPQRLAAALFRRRLKRSLWTAWEKYLLTSKDLI